MDKRFFEKLFIYSGFNMVIIEKPGFFDALPKMDKAIYSGMVGGEYFFTDRFSTVVQASANSTPYPEGSDTNVLSELGCDVGLGFSYILDKKSNSSLHLSVFENTHSASSPDVSFRAGLKWAI